MANKQVIGPNPDPIELNKETAEAIVKIIKTIIEVIEGKRR